MSHAWIHCANYTRTPNSTNLRPLARWEKTLTAWALSMGAVVWPIIISVLSGSAVVVVPVSIVAVAGITLTTYLFTTDDKIE